MANKIIDLRSTDTSAKTLEVYVDIDRISDPANAKKPTKQDIETYIAILKQETQPNGSKHCGVGYDSILVDTLSDSDKKELRMIYAEVQDYEKAVRIYLEKARFKIAKLVNVKAVQQSLHNIFDWMPGERILNPEFGSKLKTLLYQGITPMTNEQIVAEIRGAIIQWEPRVELDTVIDATTLDDQENNTIHLEIIYRIPSLSDEQYNYSYYYTRSE